MSPPALPRPLPTTATIRPKATRLLQLWEHSSMYLPVLLMGLLALGSYWLVRNNPLPMPVTPIQPPPSEPDYYMQDFALRSFSPGGELRHALSGREMRHFPSSGQTEIDQARLHSQPGRDRPITTAQAHRLQINADQTRYNLHGNVVLVREHPTQPDAPGNARTEFRSEHLMVDTQAQRLQSPVAVQLLRGNDRITAEQLDYDDHQRIAVLQGKVRVTLPAHP